MPQRKLPTALADDAILKQQLIKNQREAFKGQSLSDIVTQAGDIGSTILNLSGLNPFGPTDPNAYKTIDRGDPNLLSPGVGRFATQLANPYQNVSLPARIQPIGETGFERVVDYLTRSMLPATQEKFMKIVNMGKAEKAFRELFPREYKSAVNTYLGDSRLLRDALDIGESADLYKEAMHFMEMVNNAKKSNSTLFRASRLHEIPDLRVGAEFEHPFLSFSQGTNALKKGGFYDTGQRPIWRKSLITLPPGTKALPLSPLSTFYDEAEFAAGGKFRIEDIKPLIAPGHAEAGYDDLKRYLIRLSKID